MSDSQRPHGLQPTRLLHPWDFPGKSTGVGCHHTPLTLHLKHFPKQDRAPGCCTEEGNGVRLSGKETELGSWERGVEGFDRRFGVSPHSCCPLLPPPPSPILLCSLPFLMDGKEQTLYFLTDTCMVRQRADVNRGVPMVR